MSADLVTTATTQTVVYALVWNSLYGSILFLVVAVATRLLRRLHPAFHLALWSLVFVRLILPPDLAHRWSVGALLPIANQVESTPGVTAAGVDGSLGVIAEMGSSSALAIPATTAPIVWSLAIAACWIVGLGVSLALFLTRRRRYRLILRAAMPLSDGTVTVLANEWRQRFGIRRPVRLVRGSAGVAPFTTGVFRPTIYLPVQLLDNRGALEPVIAHEMAHVAHFDALWLALQHLVHSIYFFHPLVWLGGANLDEERERLCDATVLAAGRIRPRQYARGLLDVLRLDLQTIEAPTMSARKRRIGVRILSILNDHDNPRPRLVPALILTTALGIVALPMAATSADPPVERPAVAPVAASAAAPAVPVVPVAPVAPVSPPAAAAPEAPESPTTTVAAPAPPAAPLVLANPLPTGRVTRSWGPAVDPFTGEQITHRGIDVAAPAGTSILAPADGVVTVATEDYEPSTASGTVVVVRHASDTTTFYSHLGSIDVEVGQHVARGDVLATVGSTGKSTGPHLHFEVHHGGAPGDPAGFITAWQ